MFGEHVADLTRDPAVDVEAGRHEDQFGAFAFCRHRRHGGVNAVGAGLVACSRHHPAGGRSADCKRFAAEFWVVALFDRRVECIHVDMDDLAPVSAAFRDHLPAMSFRQDISFVLPDTTIFSSGDRWIGPLQAGTLSVGHVG